MKIACPKCGREYRLDPARIPSKGARFTCWGCQAKVEVRPVQTGDLRSQTTGEMTKPLLPEQLQSAVKSPAAVAAASSMPSSKGAPSEQRSGKTSAFEEDLDSENFITGPGLQVVKSILSPGRSGSSDAQQQEEQKKEPIKITCPKCSHEYRLDPGRIPSGGGKFTCRSCQARIEVRPVVKQERAAITSALPSPPAVTVSERPATAQLPSESTMAFTSSSLNAETSPTVELPTLSDLALPVTGDMPALSSLSAPAIFEEPSQPKAAPSTLSMQSPFSPELKSETADVADATESTMSMKSPFVPVLGMKEPPAVKAFGFEIADKKKTETEPLKSEEADSPWKLDEPTEPSLDKPKQAAPEAAQPKEAAPTSEFSAFEAAALAAEMAGLKSETLAALKSETKEEKPEPKPFDFSFKFDEAETPKLELPTQAEEMKEAVAAPPPAPPAPAFDPFATVPITAVKKPEMASIVEQSIEEKKTEKEPEKKDSVFGEGASEDLLKTALSMQAAPKPPAPPPITPAPPPITFDKKDSPQKPSQESADTLMSQFSTDSSFKDLFKKEEKKAEQPRPLPPPIKPSIPPPPQPPPPQPLRTQPPPPAQSLPKPEIKPTPPPVQSSPKPESKPTPPQSPPPALDIKPDPKIVSDEPAPIRFVYHADKDTAHHEEPVHEEPERSIVSRVAIGGIVGLAAVVVVAVVYFFFLRPSPAPPPDQQAQNIPSSNTPAPSNTGTGTTEPSQTPGQSASPGQPANPEPAKPEPTQTQSAKPEPPKPEPPKPEPTKPVKPEPAKPVSTAPSGDGKYTIQLAAAPTEAEAKKIGDRVQAAGFQPYIVRADLGDKGVWYRVRMGRYGSSAEANKAAAQAKAKGFNCFIGLYQ